MQQPRSLLPDGEPRRVRRLAPLRSHRGRPGGLRLAALTLAALALAGCTNGSAASTGPTTPSAATSATGPAVESPATASATPTAVTSPASQTDTSWGRIWDSLPPGFPAFSGLVPGTTTGGPASASLVIPGNQAKAIDDWYATSLATAGYTVDGRSGPAEDGSYVINAHGSTAGCKVQTTVKPLGSMTQVLVMYGAACPFK